MWQSYNNIIRHVLQYVILTQQERERRSPFPLCIVASVRAPKAPFGKGAVTARAVTEGSDEMILFEIAGGTKNNRTRSPHIPPFAKGGLIASRRKIRGRWTKDSERRGRRSLRASRQFRRSQEIPLIRHPPCVRRRMTPSPEGEGFEWYYSNLSCSSMYLWMSNEAS